MTPSHRKVTSTGSRPAEIELTFRQYLEMIKIWGGWSPFQQLLNRIGLIGNNHDVSISNVAVRWILDHDFVGAFIIGARMGISEHIEENLGVFSFRLDEEDKKLIGEVLERSNARAVFEQMSDCGAEMGS